MADNKVYIPEGSINLLTQEQIKQVVRETVQEIFLSLGLNVSDASDKIEYQQDMHYLRTQRVRRESTTNKVWFNFVGMVMSAAGAALLLGVAQALSGRSQ